MVQGIFLLRLVAGALLSVSMISYALDWGVVASFVVLALSWGCVTCAIYVYNGVQDVEEDRVNGSGRPIARGDLGVTEAMAAVGVLGALGLLGGILMHRDLVWALAAMLVMGWMYSGPPLYLKRWPAGLAVIVVVSAVLTYYAGYVASGAGGSGTALLVFATAMALWVGLVGQSKDLSDVEGDRKAGRRSLPVVWGEGAARLAISGVALTLGSIFLLATFFLAGGLVAVAVVVRLGAGSVAALSLGPWGRGSKSRCRRPYKAFMATQYAAHAAVIFLSFGYLV